MSREVSREVSGEVSREVSREVSGEVSGAMAAAVGHADLTPDTLAAVAGERGATPQQICLAWHLSHSKHVIPIPGATRPESVRSSARAAAPTLTAEELARLDDTAPTTESTPR
ncbi:aldo/keto reductase [Streptomyces sp. NPDC002845]